MSAEEALEYGLIDRVIEHMDAAEGRIRNSKNSFPRSAWERIDGRSAAP